MGSSVLRVAVWAGCLSVGAASATNLSFTGTFLQDDQLEVFLFTAPTNSFTAETWSYAGGTNANLQPIPAGGFAPVLSLFDDTGVLVATVEANGTTADPVTGFMWDSVMTVGTLNSGESYTLVLSEFDNLPGATYSAGFSQSGQGNFTPAEFGCGGTAPFCDPGVDQRNGTWAVDIDGVGTASDVTPGVAPEPGSMLPLSAGLATLALLRRRRKRD
jgi:hypothetical protein